MAYKWSPVIMLGMIIMLLQGCAPTGKNYAALIEEIESYAIEGKILAEYEHIWQAVRAVIKAEANITEDSMHLGTLKAERDDAQIEIRLMQIKLKYGLLKVRVYDQQTLQPDLAEAKRLFEEIDGLVSQIQALKL